MDYKKLLPLQLHPLKALHETLASFVVEKPIADPDVQQKIWNVESAAKWVILRKVAEVLMLKHPPLRVVLL